MPDTDPYGSSFTIPNQLHVDALSFDGDLLTIHASTEGPTAECPLCEQPSRRVHGYYTRTLADLPWCATPVRFRVRVRKFFCDEPVCERRIFAERLDEVARVHARSTNRQREALEWIAFALGGEAGARLARELGLLVSPDTLLNRIRGAFRVEAEDVRVLGVDDFGFRKGNVPGTILVDLERRQIVDLFEGHSKESIAQWLRQHPGVEVVSRDRSPVCREGINDGAPEAMQVADRWHLLHNLTQLLEEFLLHKRPALRDAVSGLETKEAREAVDVPDPTRTIRPGSWQASKEEATRQRHERLIEQWNDIRRLHLGGADVRFISRKLGISPRTVYRYKDLEEPPPRQSYTTRASVLDPYVPYLLGRWNEGCRNGKRLLREIRERGYSNSERTFIRFTGELRRAEAAGKPPSSAPRARKGSIAGLSPTAKNVAALFMRREEKLSQEQKEYLERLCASDGTLSDARRLTQEFAKMVRGLEGEKLDGWLKDAEASEATVMEKFAVGVKKDLSAVRAGLTESWSTGPVEGFITKLKLLKRQGYGRANFDLLRARALAA
ncbi:MAG: ISL3 family transposase [Actinobacteria bacterium]|nr:ISL3 family transposase [Actinomycetota bacterium]